MRFKNRHQQGSKMPAINLIPMLTVLMGVLAFFVVVSSSLSEQQGINVDLPSADGEGGDAASGDLPDPLIVNLTTRGIALNGSVTEKPQVLGQVKGYIDKNPKGVVLLMANEDVPYDQVVQLLGDLRDVGGEKISLGFEASEESEGEATEEGQE